MAILDLTTGVVYLKNGAIAGTTSITFATGGALRTGTTAADTLLIQGYDTSGTPQYRTVATVTAVAGVPTIAIPILTGPLAVNAGTITAATTPSFSVVATVNNANVDQGVRFVFTDTSSAAGFLPFQVLGGAAGATNLFKVAKDGNTTVGGTLTTNSTVSIEYTSALAWGVRSRMKSSADGLITLLSNSEAGFTTLYLGPPTSNTGNGTWQMSKVSVTCTIASDTNCSGKGTGTITITGAANLIPAGSVVFGVTARVTTIIAGSDGIATWALGTAADPDAWGAGLALAATTTVDGTAFTATTPLNFPSATAVTFSGTGGKIIDSGVIKVTIYYFSFIPISA